jgi:hypothetical protein
MEYQFQAIEWKRLTALQRAHRCRLLAEEAIAIANSASPELKDRFHIIAEQFARLAADLEAQAKF